MGTKRSFAIWGMLFVPMVFFAQSNQLTPFKISIFQDAVQIGQKGILRFHQQKAEVPLGFDLDPATVDLVANGEFQVAWFRFRKDSVMRDVPVENWADVLKANISRKVSILYQIGADFDEVDGNIRWVNEENGLLLLHGTDGAEYFITLDQVRQVIVDNLSNYKINKKQEERILEIKLSNDVPFVPLELYSLHTGISWRPVCRIRIISSDKALLQMNALVENNLFDFPEVEVEVSPGSILAKGQMSSEIMEVGKISLKKSDKLMMNFRELELDYKASYETSIPWNGLNLNTRQSYSVQSLMSFEVPTTNSFPCKTYAVIDENNRNIANIELEEDGGKGAVVLNMGQEKSIKVACVEVQKKLAKKPTKVGSDMFIKASIEGKIVLYNLGAKYVEMDVFRTVKGEFTGTTGGKVRVDEQDPSLKIISWKEGVDPGQKKEIRYKFDTMIPYQK